MTRASDTAKLLGAGATILDGTTITTADNTDQLILKSTDADAAVGPVLRLNRDSASPADGDLVGSIIWQADNDNSGETTEIGQIFAQFDDVSNGAEDGSVYIKTRTNGSLISRIGLYASTTCINDDGADIDFRVESDNDANAFFVEGSTGKVALGINTADGFLHIKNNFQSDIGMSMNDTSGSGGTAIRFKINGTTHGSIAYSGSGTAYNTSSDYRLKENVDYTFDATTRLKKLKPARFNFISDDTNTLVDGFIAHEVQSVVPEAISGDKDATETYTDDDGKEQTRPSYQGIDQAKLVPLLVKTIQELEARITALES